MSIVSVIILYANFLNICPRLRVFSGKSLRPLAILKYHSEGVGVVGFSENNLLAGGCKDGKISLWDVYQNVWWETTYYGECRSSEDGAANKKKKKLGSPCLTGRWMFDIPSSNLFRRIFKIFSYQINDF